MMMPANFSAVSENEMTYVMGGASLADYLCPVMETAQWQNFSKNMVTIVGNKYLSGFLTNTVGAMFSGTWKPGVGMAGFGKQFGDIWATNYTADKDAAWDVKAKQGIKGAVNVGLGIVGNLAAIYNLGFGTAKNIVNDTVGTETKFGW